MLKAPDDHRQESGRRLEEPVDESEIEKLPEGELEEAEEAILARGEGVANPAPGELERTEEEEEAETDGKEREHPSGGRGLEGVEDIVEETKIEIHGKRSSVAQKME